MTESATIVQRLWNYCNVLRDDGMSYGDYVKKLTLTSRCINQDEPPFQFSCAIRVQPLWKQWK